MALILLLVNVSHTFELLNNKDNATINYATFIMILLAKCKILNERINYKMFQLYNVFDK